MALDGLSFGAVCGRDCVGGCEQTEQRSPYAARSGSALSQYRIDCCEFKRRLQPQFRRSSGADRSRFFEYALGSAREAREWYYLGEPLLGDEVVTHRVDILNQIIRLLVTMLPDQRKLQLKEDPALYNPTIDPSTNF